jgi:hypothetical protein
LLTMWKPLCPGDSWRNRGNQTLRQVAFGNSASLHRAFRPGATLWGEIPKRIRSTPTRLHFVLRSTPICGTNPLGPYDAYGPHKRTRRIVRLIAPAGAEKWRVSLPSYPASGPEEISGIENSLLIRALDSGSCNIRSAGRVRGLAVPGGNGAVAHMGC